ncbi:iron transporter [Streptomyces sp. SID14478]|uniref:IucA/IucC family protein n=1 Tax=Streptomyces sp. SID14478 TaxID=2706073 RepID=UPI0013E06CC7|nr:IucA/IucC family protein [Streptomyces sp. SID14478]NEB80226.1 iron transporter [Streptomyces sp. SID14478]
MNATPAPDGRSRPLAGGACDTQSPREPERDTVPRQKGGGQDAGRLQTSTVDLLEHPDPATAAQAAAVENLLRCWVRENNIAPPSLGALRVPLAASGTALLVPIHYWSATGWHRFGLPYLEDGPHGAPCVDAVTLAALLSRESARGDAASTATAPTWADGGAGAEQRPAAEGHAAPATWDVGTPEQAASGPDAPARTVRPPVPSGDGGDLVGRVADSVRRTTEFIADRRRRRADDPDRFLAAEQALLLGHPLHPTPKSREGLSEAESRRYSPELRGSFPLHWIAVAPAALAHDSAWTERGRAVTATHLTSQLAGPGLPLPDGHAALPLHPWQIRELTHRPDTAALLDAGLLRDLGPYGEPWFPTSSVRTLYRPGAPAMLKLSLGLRITNSRRENLRKELHRGVEVHRLLRGGLAEQWHAAHPGFDIVRDPAWLAVDGPNGDPVPGLDVMIRNNPFGPDDDAACVAGFVSPRPPRDAAGATDRTPMGSQLADTVTHLAAHTGRPRQAVATEWFLRYLEHVVRPVLWLDSEAGIALEAHQQNTLLLLDADGWPTGGRYRDNQGYYFRESRRDELDRRLPGIGAQSDTFVPDDVTDERFAYYLAINNVLGLIGAFGSQQLADEQLLISAFRRFLGEAAAGPRRLRSPLPHHLLDSPTLRCKANLLTRLHGLDELVGPVDTQSVYVTIANPLHS